MEYTDLSRALRVESQRAARSLAHPLRRRLLLGCVGRPRSLTDLAAFAEVALKRLHYHVGVLCALGLLVVHDEVARAGRPIKRYVAVADAFFVPGNLSAESSSDALSAEIDAQLRRQRLRADGGVLYDLGSDGAPRMRTLRQAQGRDTQTGEIWRRVRLDRRTAARLADELAACIDRAAANASATAEAKYLVHVVVVQTPRIVS